MSVRWQLAFILAALLIVGLMPKPLNDNMTLGGGKQRRLGDYPKNPDWGLIHPRGGADIEHIDTVLAATLVVAASDASNTA